jgi:hypothetical protein
MPQINQLLARIAVIASLLIFGGSGCASSGVAQTSPQVQATGSGIHVEQVPMTPYMRSQVGTPNELSPLAPAQARNIRKVGGRWLCDMNGQVYVFDGVSTWVPQSP